MNTPGDGVLLALSPELNRALNVLLQNGVPVLAAVRTLAQSNGELFTTPGDEVIKLLARWDWEDSRVRQKH